MTPQGPPAAPQVAAGGPLACGGRHAGPGRLDETARRLSHEEVAVARLLADEGHDVRSLPESRRGGRRPDLSVCSTTVEVKSFDRLEDRNGVSPSANGVFNKLLDAAGQSRHAVLYGVGSGLTAETARRGLARYWSQPTDQPKLDHVRVLGDGFDLSWSRRRERTAGLSTRPPDRRPGLSL